VCVCVCVVHMNQEGCLKKEKCPSMPRPKLRQFDYTSHKYA
jgi:hypothetical protein